MSKKILITGGAGCLGSNLIEHLYSSGHVICAIDNFATGKKEAIPEQDRLKVIEGSVADEILVDDVFKDFQPNYVIHSAAAYKDPMDWAEDSRTNIIGSVNVAKAALENGVQRLINFQTALCYGRPTSIPIPIEHPTQPFTSYGISKTAGEAYFMNSELPTISLRLANICGPRLAIGPIPTFYKRLKEGQGCFCSESVRDFLDMSDFINLIDLALEENAPLGLFNVSTGVGNSIHDVFCEVCNYLELEIPEVPISPIGSDDIAEVVLDPSETEVAFNWRAKFDFKSTIQNQLQWYDRFGINDIFSHLALPPKANNRS